MRYYSDKLKKVFDTEELLKEAEAQEDEKLEKLKLEKEERAAEAKIVEDAFRKANEAYKDARQKMDEFCKKYGAFHYSIKDTNLPAKTLFDMLLDNFWF